LDKTDKLYLTVVDATFEDADTFFPEIDFDKWELIYNERVEADEKNDYPYNFKDYKRK
jgi:dihydrofolate reductase